MPKDSPLTASCGDCAHAALARAAMSPHWSHLRRSRPAHSTALSPHMIAILLTGLEQRSQHAGAESTARMRGSTLLEGGRGAGRGGAPLGAHEGLNDVLGARAHAHHHVPPRGTPEKALARQKFLNCLPHLHAAAPTVQGTVMP